MPRPRTGRLPLIAGGAAAILASACCLGPLVLVVLGLGGAWVGQLAGLAPYRPIFIGVSVVAMFFAWHQIFRPAQDCQPDGVCAAPDVKTAYKAVFWAVSILILLALVFPYLLPLFY